MRGPLSIRVRAILRMVNACDLTSIVRRLELRRRHAAEGLEQAAGG